MFEQFKKEKYYQTYKGQKELEEIVKKRNNNLTRPNTNYLSITLYSIIYILLIGLLIFLIIILRVDKIYKYIFSPILFIFLIELYTRFYLIQIVKCYQHYASDKTRTRCLCIPSCSEYSILALKKYLLVIALFKIHKRLYKTCDGSMYKLDNP